MIGVSPATVTRMCRDKLLPAIVGKKINMLHPTAIEYLSEKDKPKRTVKGNESVRINKKSESIDNLSQQVYDEPGDINNFIDMTLREIITRFGTDIGFVDWLKATKAIEDIHEKRLKNAVTKGDLVNRRLVKIGVIDVINGAHVKLLLDGSRTIAKRVATMQKTGESIANMESFVRDQITSFIKPVKAKITRTLKNAGN